MGRTAKQAARALLVVALIVATVQVVAPAAAGAASGSDCHTKHYRFLFWPKGHPAIKSQGFPAFPPPHTELFVGTGSKFANDQQVGYADATTSKVSTTACQAAATTPSKPATLKKTTTKTVLLVCSFKASPLVNAAFAVGGGGALVLYVKDSAAAYALMKPTGSSLQYDPKACKVKKPPK